MADFLLTENKTLVGTVKQNKPESAALFMKGKQSLFFYLCCTSDLTPLPHVPASNKTVILFSWQHHDMCMGEEQDHKLEIIMHYSDKVGVDVLDKILREYTCMKSKRQWPLTLFLNLLPTKAPSPFNVSSDERNKKFKYPVRSCRGLEL